MKRIVLITTGAPTRFRPHFMPFISEQVETMAKRNEFIIDVFVLFPIFHYLNIKYWFKYIKFKSEKPIYSKLKNCKYHSVWYISRPQKIKSFDFVNWQIVKSVKRKLKKLKIVPDVIHGHFGVIGPACEKLSEDLAVDYFITEHSSELLPVINKIGKESLLRSYKKAKKVICVSSKLQNSISRLFPGLNNLIVCANGINIDRFKIIDNFTNSNKLVFIGHLIERKGIKCMLKACSLLMMEGVSYELAIYGDGPLKKHIEYYILKNNLDKYVKLKGIFHNIEVNDILRKNDVLVLPSKKESFGVVVIEALATGLPVVSTECGGPETIIIDDTLGEIVKPNNPIELKDAIKKVLGNLTNYNSGEIRRYAENNYSWKEITDKLIKLYSEDNW